MNTLQTSPFLERLLRFLIPYFTSLTADINEARAEALETLASYGARTRAELLNAAQIIVFGMATLETLGEAKSTGMSPSMRLRFRGCANNLSRSGQKTEQTLAKRLAAEAPRPTPPAQLAEPVNDIADPQATDILQQAQAQIAACRDRLPACHETTTSQPEREPEPETTPENQTALENQAAPENRTTPENQTEPENRTTPENWTEPENQTDREKQLWGNAIMQALAQMGMPVQPIAPR